MATKSIASKKLFVPGMGSPSDQKLFTELRIDGKTLDTYMNDDGIRVYHQPLENGSPTNDHLVTSIHRTTEHTIGYAVDMRNLARDGYRIVGVFAGGLAFHLPGVVAAESITIPIIGVPTDSDAFHNVYPMPEGTPLGTVGVNKLESAVVMAQKMLNLPDEPINFIADAGRADSSAKVRKQLDELGVKYVIRSAAEPFHGLSVNLSPEKYFTGLTLCMTHDPEYAHAFDGSAEFGIIGFDKSYGTGYAREFASSTNNSLLVRGPVNLALMAARIVGLRDANVRNNLMQYRSKEAEKYKARKSAMEDRDFT